jgi:RimJ/RimL family protein N-acetyltransferase
VASRVAANKLVLLHFLDELGVRREGYLRGEIKSVDGQRRDEVLHGLLRHEWPAIRARLVARLTQPPEKIPTTR